jgi:hypothetical protein
VTTVARHEHLAQAPTAPSSSLGNQYEHLAQAPVTS